MTRLIIPSATSLEVAQRKLICHVLKKDWCLNRLESGILKYFPNNTTMDFQDIWMTFWSSIIFRFSNFHVFFWKSTHHFFPCIFLKAIPWTCCWAWALAGHWAPSIGRPMGSTLTLGDVPRANYPDLKLWHPWVFPGLYHPMSVVTLPNQWV